MVCNEWVVFIFSSGQGRNVLLAIVGIPIGNDVETVHLDNTSLKCEKPPAFPHDVYGPIGAYINGYVLPERNRVFRYDKIVFPFC